MALLRVINTPARGIGKATVERLAAHATSHGLSLLEAARDVRGIRPSRPAAPAGPRHSSRCSTGWRP